MEQKIKRRTLAKGVAWSAPVIIASASVPAYASSPSNDCPQVDYQQSNFSQNSANSPDASANIFVTKDFTVGEKWTLSVKGATFDWGSLEMDSQYNSATYGLFSNPNSDNTSITWEATDGMYSLSRLPVKFLDVKPNQTISVTATNGKCTFVYTTDVVETICSTEPIVLTSSGTASDGKGSVSIQVANKASGTVVNVSGDGEKPASFDSNLIDSSLWTLSNNNQTATYIGSSDSIDATLPLDISGTNAVLFAGFGVSDYYNQDVSLSRNTSFPIGVCTTIGEPASYQDEMFSCNPADEIIQYDHAIAQNVINVTAEQPGCGNQVQTTTDVKYNGDPIVINSVTFQGDKMVVNATGNIQYMQFDVADVGSNNVIDGANLTQSNDWKFLAYTRDGKTITRAYYVGAKTSGTNDYTIPLTGSFVNTTDASYLIRIWTDNTQFEPTINYGQGNTDNTTD